MTKDILTEISDDGKEHKLNRGLEMPEDDFKKLKHSEQDLGKEKEKCKGNLKESYFNIIDTLKKYLDLKEEYYNLVALWIIGTYFHDKFPSYPYLYFNAMKGSGKSRAMSLITTLAKDGQMLNSLTEAVLFRTKGTLGIDEFEGVSRKGNETLRELLNSAYKKGITVKRMKQKKTEEGTEQVVEEFEVYRPIIIANIWGMESVLGDRCIQLFLEKSNKIVVTNLIEIFREEKIVVDTKQLLQKVTLVMMTFYMETYKEWNNYITNNIINITNNTNTTNTTNTTKIGYANLSLFKVLDSMKLNGRELELSLPLCMIASEISQDLLKETSLVLKELFHNKREEEITENVDVSLYDFVAQEPECSGYELVGDLTRRFKQFLGSNDEEDVNPKWMGRALKRLGLIIHKKHLGRRSSVKLDYKKAKEKMRMFK